MTIYVFITIPGDLNGDKAVDIYDAIILAGHFNLDRYHVLWDSNIDINDDGFVDIFDALILAANYGRSWT
jgi:transketolase